MEILKAYKITDDKYYFLIRYDISKGVYCTYADFNEDSPPVIEVIVRWYTIYKYGDFSEEMVKRNWIDYVDVNIDLIYKYQYCRAKIFKKYVVNDIDTIKKLEKRDVETILNFVKKAIVE